MKLWYTCPVEKVKSIKQLEDLHFQHPLVMLYFSRYLCGVCHVMKPQIENVMKDYPSIILKEVNVDELPQISGQMTVFSVPAVVLLAEGKEIMRQAGYLNLGTLRNYLDRITD